MYGLLTKKSTAIARRCLILSTAEFSGGARVNRTLPSLHTFPVKFKSKFQVRT